MRSAIIFSIILSFVLLSGCANETEMANDSSGGNDSEIANPASVYCEKNSGEVIITNCNPSIIHPDSPRSPPGSCGNGGPCVAVMWTSAWVHPETQEVIMYAGFEGCEEGNQRGFCKKNSKYCEEWAFYRGECQL